MKKKLGILLTLLSAFIFGFTPVLGRLSFDGGSNSVMLALLRSLFAIPVLLVVLLIKRIPLKLTKQEGKDVLFFGTIGVATTPIFLYGAYEYISVSLSTVIHFFYPLLVSLCGIIFFKDKVKPYKIVALLFGITGIMLFFEKGGGSGSIIGYIFAIASSITYTIYIMGVEHTSLANIHYLKLTFYFSIISLIVSAAYGAFTKSITFNLTPAAWVYSFLVSILVTFFGIALFQLGIIYVGASTAAVLSTLEPITSVVAGILILGESITPVKYAACAFILVSVIIITVVEMRKEKGNQHAPA